MDYSHTATSNKQPSRVDEWVTHQKNKQVAWIWFLLLFYCLIPQSWYVGLMFGVWFDIDWLFHFFIKSHHNTFSRIQLSQWLHIREEIIIIIVKVELYRNENENRVLLQFDVWWWDGEHNEEESKEKSRERRDEHKTQINDSIDQNKLEFSIRDASCRCRCRIYVSAALFFQFFRDKFESILIRHSLLVLIVFVCRV